MVRTVGRHALVNHRCDCGALIRPGAPYLEHVLSPNHEGLGNRGWMRIYECVDCAIRYDRFGKYHILPSY